MFEDARNIRVYRRDRMRRRIGIDRCRRTTFKRIVSAGANMLRINACRAPCSQISPQILRVEKMVDFNIGHATTLQNADLLIKHTGEGIEFVFRGFPVR